MTFESWSLKSFFFRKVFILRQRGVLPDLSRLLVLQVMPAQPPILPRLTSLLSRALVALGLQEQRPALNLLPLLLTSLRQARPSQQGPD